ncbi:MAG: hypothetical protein ACE5I2_02380 [Anaerolineae bacterium]
MTKPQEETEEKPIWLPYPRCLFCKREVEPEWVSYDEESDMIYEDIHCEDCNWRFFSGTSLEKRKKGILEPSPS